MGRHANYARGIVAVMLLCAGATRAANESPKTRLAAIETRVGGRFGAAALTTESGQQIEYRAGERFPMCSTFKTLAAAAVLKRVDEKNDQLDRVVPYTEKDLLKYAPVTREHVHEGGLTLSALCAAGLIRSDNTAGNLLLKTIGGPAGLTRFARSLGDKQTRLDRMELDLNSAVPGDERNTNTPAAMLENLRALLLGDALSTTSRAQFETWLTENKTGGDLLRAGLPNGWRVGDKTGRGGNGAINDIAIIRPPGNAPIFLAVYSVGSTASPQSRRMAIADVARLIAETF